MATIDEWMDDGHGALAIGDLEEAAKCFREVVTHRYPEAIEAGLRAARIDPNNQFVWSSLSLAYNGNKQKAEAEWAGAKARIISWGGKISPDAINEKPSAPA
jgi:hypothetical protein